MERFKDILFVSTAVILSAITVWLVYVLVVTVHEEFGIVWSGITTLAALAVYGYLTYFVMKGGDR
jgi:hypothetical protein